jgi:hypothetical protein
MRSIGIREELTGEWKNRGVGEQREYAILTAEVSKAAFGVTPSEYAELKGLEDGALLPEGTRVTVIPVEPTDEACSLGAWLRETRQVRAKLPLTSDSVGILEEIRQERADR